MSTDAHLAGAIARLALNYGRSYTPDALAGMLDTWRRRLSNYQAVDVDDAVDRILGDANRRTMPTIADVAVLAAESQARRQRASAHVDVRGTVACTTCDDSGWLDAGTDEDGYSYVQPCPKGCLPPPARSTREISHRRRRTPTHQGRITETLPADVIDAQARMIGDRPHPHDEQF